MSEIVPILLIAVFLFGAPLVLAIVALAQTGRLRREVEHLSIATIEQLARMRRELKNPQDFLRVASSAGAAHGMRSSHG